MATTYKVRVRANPVSDAEGNPYLTYQIPEPKSFAKWYEGVKKMNEQFPANRLIAIENAVDAKPPPKFRSVTVNRGGTERKTNKIYPNEPVELTGVTEELLEVYRNDRQISVDILETFKDKEAK